MSMLMKIQVNYVNAHATSTRVGDLAEVNAIKTVFKNQHEMKMNGTKAITRSPIYEIFDMLRL